MDQLACRSCFEETERRAAAPGFVEEQLCEVAQLLPVQRDNGAESRRAAGFGSQQSSVAAAAKVVPCMRGAVESFRQTGRAEA
jgi:hypothetical protein